MFASVVKFCLERVVAGDLDAVLLLKDVVGCMSLLVQRNILQMFDVLGPGLSRVMGSFGGIFTKKKTSSNLLCLVLGLALAAFCLFANHGIWPWLTYPCRRSGENPVEICYFRSNRGFGAGEMESMDRDI